MTKEILEAEEEALTAGRAKCIKQHAQNAGRKQKFPSSPTEQDPFTARTATSKTDHQENIKR